MGINSQPTDQKKTILNLENLFYPSNIMSNIRLQEGIFKIVCNFSLLCHCVSFTEEIDLCLMVGAIFGVRVRKTIYILPLKVP